MIEDGDIEEGQAPHSQKKDGMWLHYVIILLNAAVLIILSQELSFRDSYDHHRLREAVRSIKVAAISLEKDIVTLSHSVAEDYSSLEQNQYYFMEKLKALKAETTSGVHHTDDVIKVLLKASQLSEDVINTANSIEKKHKEVVAIEGKLSREFAIIESKLIDEHNLHWLYMLVRNLKLDHQFYVLHQSELSHKNLTKRIERIKKDHLSTSTLVSRNLPDLRNRLRNLLELAEARVKATSELRQSVSLFRAFPQMQTYDQLYYMFENEFALEEEQINTVIILFYILLLGSWLHVGYLILELRKRNKIIQKKSDDFQKHYEDQKELNELQRKFVSMVSHEFRTPLAIIDSGAQKILRRVEKMPANKIKEVAMKTRAHINKLIELLDSTLHSQRMDAGQMELMAGQCDLKLIISDVCQLQYEIHTKNSIQLQISDLPHEIMADEKLIGHVFTNLISNAVKYSPEGTEVIVVGHDRGEFVEVEVKDSGVGIPEEEISELFGCFYRASTSIGISGTGIGLHLVKNIIDKHHGEIEVESAVGEGSTFRVRLPKVQPDEVANDDNAEIVEKVA